MVGQVGHSVTLQFEVNGSPLPSVVWEHEEMGEVKMSPRQHVVELSGGVTSLTISDLCRADEGVYTCTAVNHLGAVSATCRLTVLGKGSSMLKTHLLLYILYSGSQCPY